MTTCCWDKEEITSEFASCETLQDIIQKIEKSFVVRGEVICEIHVNGMRLAEEDESRLASSRREDISDLMVQTSSPGRLIGQALQSCREFLPQLRASCVATADTFRAQDITEARGKFLETLESCSWFVDTLMHVRGASTGQTDIIRDFKSWKKAETRLHTMVQEMSTAYEKRDYVLTADLLEYEVSEALSDWQPILEKQN
jgi:hypothetical protein